MKASRTARNHQLPIELWHAWMGNLTLADAEIIERHSFESKAQARMVVFAWIEGWYNPWQRHSGTGYVSPLNFERSQQSRFNAREHFAQHADETPQMV